MKVVNSLMLSLVSISFLMYFFSSHPMMIASTVIFQSVMMATLITKKILFSWFSFFIFIIYLGGILMLFSYIISLINSKEPLLWKNKMIYSTLLILFLLNISSEKKSFLETNWSKFPKLIMSSFSINSMTMSIYLMLFLLLVMVMVVFLTETSKGNMRSI